MLTHRNLRLESSLKIAYEQASRFMNVSKQCCVLNGGNGAWAFEPLASQLSVSVGIPVSAEPREFNYVLCVEEPDSLGSLGSFIPLEASRVASDKRMLASVFNNFRVPTPRTVLLDQFNDVSKFIGIHAAQEWCLKYPTSCGANGHRMLTVQSPEPPNWPRPFVVQEFIRLARPQVFRTYCAGGELFGWVVRQFADNAPTSPWVAHARGAHYECLGETPENARPTAQQALRAAGLWDSFGCVDLLPGPNGEWLALEVGTDGLFNHVDRAIGNPDFERFLNEKLSAAFLNAARKFLIPTASPRLPA